MDRARLAALGPGGLRALQGAVGNRALSRLVKGARPRRAVLARRPSSATRRMLLRYSRSAAVAYAKKWAKIDNPAYGRIEPNDCTNFVSQTLLAGGWTMAGGSCDDRKSDQAWWFGPRECRWVGGRPWTTEVKASFTWGGAQNLYNHMQTMGRGTTVANPMDLEPGDILQMDMGEGHYGAGRIGHSMVVTEKTTDDLKLSYHEPQKLDEPFSAISGRYPKARWFPWQPNTRTPTPPARRPSTRATRSCARPATTAATTTTTSIGWARDCCASSRSSTRRRCASGSSSPPRRRRARPLGARPRTRPRSATRRACAR